MNMFERLSLERPLESEDRERLPDGKSYSRPLAYPEVPGSWKTPLLETSYFY